MSESRPARARRDAAAPPGATHGASSGPFWTRLGPWFWALVVFGLAARVFFATATQGTTDVAIWADHAQGIAERGLAVQYRESQMLLNHPPLAGWWMAWMWRLAEATGLSFGAWLRLPIALADLANVALLAALLRGRRERWLVAGTYAVVPLALVFGAYHGNTDSVLATLLLAASLALVRGRHLVCGAILGVGLAVKLPIVLGAPALCFAAPTWRKRGELVGATLVVALGCYAPVLLQDFAAVREKVFGYQGLVIFSLSQPPTFIWGLKNHFIELWGYDARVEVWRGAPGLVECWPGWALFLVQQGHRVALALIVAYAFLRRRSDDARGVAETLAFSYAIFYALVDAWAFQYLAWALPFWLLGGRVFGWAANLAAGGYVYGLYAYVCADPLLRGLWNFNGRPNWPEPVKLLRDAALWTFVVFGAWALVRALLDEFRQGKRPGTPRSAK
ncbi:MAG: hypothetical protein L6Q99_22495 [Planctomycetes bacterium]|nr:hypothetical protein [Planctomycetota bacterium]